MSLFTKKNIVSIALTVGMVTNLCIPYSVMAAAEYKEITDEPIISDAVLKEMKSGKSEIPVIIWRNSVSDKDIEGQVKEKIGFTINDLEEKYDLPSPELINELSKAAQGDAKEYLEVLMKSHMDLTASSRKKENEKTELYLKTRRSIVSEIYSEKTQEFIEKTEIDNKSVLFSSNYAPMMICNLTPAEIKLVSENDDVEEIELYTDDKEGDCAFPSTNVKSVMGINKINQYLNLTGENVNIGIYESNKVDKNNTDYDLNMSKVNVIYGNKLETDHATWVAAVAAGNQGIAPNANILSVSNHTDWEGFSASGALPGLECLIDENVKLINVSWGIIKNTFCYDNWAKYFDNVVSSSKVTIVCATGNVYGRVILSPSSSYNCIAVNAFKKVNNENLLCEYSYMTDGYGCIKPDVIAETFGAQSDLGGTSTATPVITGMISLLLEYKPNLAAHPELIKAILMASCHEKATRIYNKTTVLNEPLSEGISLHQGAGIPNMYNMISIASQHSYGSGTLEDDEISIPIVQPKYNAQNMNVAFSYLQSNISISQDKPVNYDNYNIRLTAGSTSKTSENPNSSTELIYTDLFSSDNKYTLKIFKNSGNSQEISYGYAWSTDNVKFIPTLAEEGLYSLRNKAYNTYMTNDPSNSRCTLNSYTGNNNQIWAMKYNSSTGKYTMQSAYGTSDGMKTGTTISGSYKNVAEGTSSQAATVTIQFNGDGSYTFLQYINGTKYALDKYSNYVAWAPYNEIRLTQRWYMESLQWRRGDVNMDGVINSADANAVSQYLTNSSVLTSNIQKFLADANLDGIIDVSDVSYINLGLC
ncbi:MAG: S8 family serine peptidase [Oscillospiraceae bacterium]|nr:S8 family serine peptidase [Oscillospiraceae bacterium]